MFKEMAKRLHEVVLLIILAIFFKVTGNQKPTYSRAHLPPPPHHAAPVDGSYSYYQSWRLAVEANNVHGWRTVPSQFFRYIEAYMIGGQYERDVEFLVEQVLSYASGIALSKDAMDAWILDVDDTCISNILFYKGRRYGCEPYDSAGYKAWALKGRCPAIPAVLALFKQLVGAGFKLFLVTGRDQETLGQVTIHNLHNQGFVGYQRLVLRTMANKGQRAIAYKSGIRKQLVEEGYRIWGNVGDQWSDLQGEFPGYRTFKLPNPMYFIS